MRHSYLTHTAEALRDPAWRQRQAGHKLMSTTSVYTNSRELHQTGEKPQVAMSGRCSCGLSRVLSMAS